MSWFDKKVERALRPHRVKPIVFVPITAETPLPRFRGHAPRRDLNGQGAPAKPLSAPPEQQQLTGSFDPYGVTRILSNHRLWPGIAYRSKSGECKWCGRTILAPDGSINKKRRFCDRACVREYRLRADPRRMRRFIYDRDMGICQACGAVYDYFEDSGFEVDHIKPLFAARGDWSFWDPPNLQLLCKDPCHLQKTKDDARKYRAALSRRRERKSRNRFH